MKGIEKTMKKKKLLSVMLCLSLLLACGTTAMAEETTETTETTPGVEEHQHILKTTRDYDEEECWLACRTDGCEYRENILQHNFSIIIDQKPTATEPGKAHSECDFCHYQKAYFTVDFFDPDCTADTKVWNGSNDIVINFDAKGVDASVVVQEIHVFAKNNPAYHFEVSKVLECKIHIDQDGKGAITISKSEMEKLKEYCKKNNVSIEKMDTLEVWVWMEKGNNNKDFEIQIPIKIASKEPEKTPGTDKPNTGDSGKGNQAAGTNSSKPVKVTSKEVKAPKTGDTSSIALLGTLCALSAFGIVIIAKRKKYFA